MTRQTITDLKTTIDVDILDNTSQLITPATVRTVLKDMIDSAAPMIAITAGTNNTGVAVPLTTTPSKLPGSFFTSALSSNTAVFEARSSPFGDLQSHTGIGRLFCNFDVTISVANGTDVVFTLAQNGVVLPFRSVIVGRGVANQISTSFSWMFTSIADLDTFDIRAASLTGTPTITLFGAAIKAILLPQFF